MVNRTKGYILLTLLMLTGLAGQQHSNTITNKERKMLISELKQSKTNFLKSVNDLSGEQLSFKVVANQWSINDYIQFQAQQENSLWQKATTALKENPNRNNHLNVKQTDEELLNAFSNCQMNDLTAASTIQIKETNTFNVLHDFKSKRNDIITFTKYTTDDLRNHIALYTTGAIDAYQLLLLIPASTDRCTQKINAIKTSPHFPN